MIGMAVQADPALTAAIGAFLDELQVERGLSPLTVAASVAARVDLLGEDLKRIVQAAAVMGRVFSADMLDQVAPSGRDVIDALAEIVRFGLVVPIGDPADRMFAFKHVLTQNAIEKEMLHDERRALHDRAARAYEVLYADRLPEFYETIAFHFERGHAAREAVRYLVRAGEKSLSRYAVNQASRYFRRAYEIALETPTLAADSVLLVDLLVRWARVDYYLGSFRELESLMLRHYASLEYVAPELQARYEVWLGTVFWHRQSLSRAYEHLTRGRALAEQADEPPWVALADAELAYVHADLGRLPEAVECSERACAAARLLDSDAFVWEEAFSSAGYTHWCTGNVAEAHRLGAELLAYGTAHTNIRCLAFGHWMVSLAYLNDGDFKSATEETDKALRVSADPWLLQFPKFFSAICSVFNGEFDRALPLLEEVVEYSTERGAETLSIPATGLLGAARAGTGSLDGGIAMLERCERRLRDDERLWAHINAIYILGELHAIIARGEAEMGLREALRNPRFLVGHAPFAERRAYRYLEQAASGCDSVGAVGLAGQCWLSIAELQHAKGHDARSADSFERARSRFVACGAQTFAKRAASELAELSS